MREGESQAVQEAAAQPAYMFDGWSMVPIDAPRPMPAIAEPEEAETGTLIG